MNEIELLEDKVMAMDFAFTTLAKALHERGVLPIQDLADRLDGLSEQLRQPSNQPGRLDDLSGVSEQLAELRAWLLQLQ